MSAGGKVVSTIDLSKVRAGIADGAEKGLRLVVEFLLTEANKTVPHDEGTLERSGEASVDGKRGAVSYDTPYAVKQHEDMTLSHDGKGEPKWLENTLSREKSTAGDMLARTIRGELGT